MITYYKINLIIPVNFKAVVFMQVSNLIARCFFTITYPYILLEAESFIQVSN